MSLTTRQSRMLGTSDGAAATVAPAVLGLRSVCTQQPQQPVGIDPAYLPGLQVFLPMNAAYGLKSVGTNVVTVSNSGTPSTTSFGTAYDYSGSNQYTNIGDLFYSDSLTICATFVADVIDANARGIVQKRNVNGSGATNEWSLAVSSSGVAFAAWNSSDVTVVNIGGGAPVAGKKHTVCVVHRGSGKLTEIWLDGVLVNSATASGTIRNSTSTIEIGAWSGNNASRWFNGRISNVGIWSIASQFGKDLSQNPWQIFRPINRQVWVAA